MNADGEVDVTFDVESVGTRRSEKVSEDWTTT